MSEEHDTSQPQSQAEPKARRRLFRRGRDMTPEQRSRRRKRFFIAGVVGLVLLALVIIPGYLSSRSQFMKRYEKFQPQYQAWASSVHASVHCEQCHVKPGFLPQTAYRAYMLGQFYVSLVARSNPPKAIGTPPTNAACQSCHPDYRTVSPSGDLNIPHRAHVGVLKLKCVQCHGYLVHDKNPEGNNKPRMESCLTCHDGKQAKNSCATCHTRKAVPANHRAKDWDIIHPTMQAKMDCAKCHGWTENWCAECHTRRPPSHGKNWRSTHGAAVKTRRNCEACHTAEFCIKCHGEVPKLNFNPAVKLVR